MSEPDETQVLSKVLCELGILTGGTLPMALRVARRRARELLAEQDAHDQECAAVRLVALVMMTNAMFLLKQSALPDKLDIIINENVKFAKGLIASGSDEESSSSDWMSVDELKKLFEEGA